MSMRIIAVLLYCGLAWYSTGVAAEPGYNGQNLQNPRLGKGVLLIAGRNLNDPNFSKSVVLITEFNETGTVGLVINRRTMIPLAEVFPQIGELTALLEHLYLGGPVATHSIRLLVQAEELPDEAKHVFDDIYLVDTHNLFNQIIQDEPGRRNLKLYAGYAGWAPGQLESELLRGDWYIWHASAEIIFNMMPEDTWNELIQVATAKWVMLSVPDK
jgi:putative transcriptional regulator